MTTTRNQTALKTIDALLAEGQRILAEQDRREEEVEFRLAVEALDAWRALREQVVKDVGELAERLPYNPPDGFLHIDGDHTFEFAPWGGSSLFIRYEKNDGAWLLRGKFNHGDRNKSISVQTHFHPCWEGQDDEPAAWRVVPHIWHETDNLAEALALCHRASTGAYYDCVQECQKRKPPTYAQKPEAEQPLVLTKAETALVLAFREMIAGIAVEGADCSEC